MKIVIAGGQSKADFLIEMFKKEHHKLVVINDSLSYGTYLAKKHKVDVIINDPTSKFVLEEAQIENFDVLVALLPNDADNLALCQIAKSVFSVKKTVASVSDPRNVQYFRMMGVDTAISATYMISKYIEKASESMKELIMRHALRNIAMPAITLQFASFSELFGGIALAETVFSYPGIGSAVTAAALNADVPLLIALAVFSAIFVFAGNFIANILYGIVDPRLKEGGYHA